MYPQCAYWFRIFNVSSHISLPQKLAECEGWILKRNEETEQGYGYEYSVSFGSYITPQEQYNLTQFYAN